MAIVRITPSLEREVNKRCGPEAVHAIELMMTLKQYPKKGKLVGVAGASVIKELKYRKWRFYFVTNGYMVKFLKVEELQDLMIKFVAMSDKKGQQQMIDQIKRALRDIDSRDFDGP